MSKIKLSKEQYSALVDVISARETIMLTGPAGTGKTFLTSTIENVFKQNNIRVDKTSSTGASAVTLSGPDSTASTIHSFSGIGICGSIKSASKRVTKNKKVCYRIRTCQVLIIDEVSMLSGKFITILDHIFKLVRNNNKPFGGIQIIFVGDFCQLPPVKASHYAFESPAWIAGVKKVHVLVKIFRQTDKLFCTALNKIRKGVKYIDQQTIDTFAPCINRQFDDDIKPTKLFCTRRDVEVINHNELMKLVKPNNKMIVFNAFDQITSRNGYTASTKDILAAQENLNKNTTSVQELKLCIGAQVMLVINLDMDEGLCNGTRGVVVDFSYNKDNKGNVCIKSPIVKFTNGIKKTMDLNECSRKINQYMTIKRQQYPLILAWAMTIHKSQGATISKVETDLSRPFGHAQIYTCLSRCMSLEGLSITGINWNKATCDPRVEKFYKQNGC